MDNSCGLIEQFIVKICFPKISAAIAEYAMQTLPMCVLNDSIIKTVSSAKAYGLRLMRARDIHIKGDTLSFNAVIDSLIDFIGDDGCDLNLCEISQRFVVSCEAVVTDKLESLEVSQVQRCSSDMYKAPERASVSNNIVPFLGAGDLEAEAEQFLEQYYPEALQKPMPIPITAIAQGMGLDIIHGYRITNDFSVFGGIYFTDSKATVYDLSNAAKITIDVHRGDILVDAYTFWGRNLGCVKNTIAHEVYHWYKHRMYAAIKHVLYGEDFVACRCPSKKTYTRRQKKWTDVQHMEWQANNMAPRILMPYRTFRIKVEELLKQYDYEHAYEKDIVLKAVAEELRIFYGVSRQSVLIRMKETGYRKIVGDCTYNSKPSPYHNCLSPADAFYAYRTSDEFRKLIDSGLFKHADGYFVINDAQYVKQSDNGEYKLTDFALSNLDACTLQFSWESITLEEISQYFPLEHFYRSNAGCKVSQYDAHKNAATIELSEEIIKKREAFERRSKEIRLISWDKTCWQAIFAILESREISKSHFCTLTELGEEVYRKAEKNVNTKPSLRTIVAIARGLDLDIEITEKLLQLAGHTFDGSDEHQALKYCITGFSGKSVKAANEFLESYNYPPLGLIARK